MKMAGILLVPFHCLGRMDTGVIDSYMPKRANAVIWKACDTRLRREPLGSRGTAVHSGPSRHTCRTDRETGRRGTTQGAVFLFRPL